YFAQQLANGNYLISTGYGACLVELTSAGELVRTIGGRGGHPDIAFKFLGDAQVIANGQVAVANWTGHKPADSHKAAQVVEFDAEGQVVWSWHDPERAGSIHGVAFIQ
ncbi:MAG: hypothetical protein ACYTF0_01350, partial [Planctomycetota bacterium]